MISTPRTHILAGRGGWVRGGTAGDDGSLLGADVYMVMEQMETDLQAGHLLSPPT